MKRGCNKCFIEQWILVDKCDQTQLTNQEIDDDQSKDPNGTLTWTIYWQTIDNVDRRTYSIEMSEEKGK